MIIKCKMCGGDIEFTPGATYGTCEYCGSTSTIPKAEDEVTLNRYNRANHFRRQCEFDKAVAAYEKILEQDDTDAEAHWGAVLSRYGIEYVEDPTTKKRIPTCHRLQVASILADADYLAAVDHAPDEESRSLYEEQAAQIADIQKGILAISANEKPYDVFICYKETDENGQRTRDSQWAQDVYYGLTDAGYKVFFSRITLEDKLGQQYEPYIFAALNSAKVMVAIGSKAEYFNAVWVKNEWSRYLALMAKDRKRLLIPCYRDMDPYDLPDELSSLQSQDMSKIGFMQDLLRGVKKILDADKKSEPVKQSAQVVTAASTAAVSPGVTSLMERAYLFMEDGNFASAEEYLDRVLDIDPKFASAYVAKVCVTFQLRREAELAETTFQYEDNADWRKAMRFANPQQKAVYENYAAKVKERTERQIRDYSYDCAMEMAVNPYANKNKLDKELSDYKVSCTHSDGCMADGSRRKNSQMNEDAFRQIVKSNEPGDLSEQNLNTAAAMFDEIKDSDAAECAGQCRALAEQARQKQIYNNAATAYRKNINSPTELEKAAAVFLSVPQYKDAKERALRCMDDAKKIRDDLYNDAVKAMQEAGKESAKWEKAKKLLAEKELDSYPDIKQLRTKAAEQHEKCLAAEKEQARRNAAKKKRNSILGVVAAAVAVVVLLLVTKVIIPASNYRKAESLRANGRYEEAVAAFTNAGGYSDAATQIRATYYAEGEAKREAGEWTEAVEAFKNAGDYSDAATQIKATYYAEGEAKRAAEDWDEAREAFASAGDYSDAATQIMVTYYAEGEAKREAGEWTEAVEAFTNAGDYSDAATQIKETEYQKAQALYASADYANAYTTYKSISGYKDVDNLLETDENLKAAAAAALEAKFTVGNYVEFGTYPQTRSGTDSTPIEWLVLARDGNKALLISRYGLDEQPYNTKWTEVTWKGCTLRTWLNGTFMNKAFTANEQTGILMTNVDNSSSQGYSGWSTSGGNNTQDKIFLLSYAEANQYLDVTYDDSNNMKSRVAPTAYAKKQGADTSDYYKTADGDESGWWWLRSPGKKLSAAARVYYDGSLSNNYYVNYGSACVRPALWVDLESGIF